MKVLAATLLIALAGIALGAPGAPPRRIVAEVSEHNSSLKKGPWNQSYMEPLALTD